MNAEIAGNRTPAEREADLISLAAFANLGDEPADWRAFREKWPNFFPTQPTGYNWDGFQTLTDLLYTFAEEIAAEPVLRKHSLPALLWYREHLRRFWAHNDPEGVSLSVLLGFEEEARAAGNPQFLERALVRPMIVPGQSTDPSKQNIGGLPRGKVVINGRTGEISWEFSCAFQRAVYELNRNRWCAKVCPQCGTYFVAAKPANKLCSSTCFNEAKRARTYTWWSTTGAAQRRAKQETARKRKSARKKE